MQHRAAQGLRTPRPRRFDGTKRIKRRRRHRGTVRESRHRRRHRRLRLPQRPGNRRRPGQVRQRSQIGGQTGRQRRIRPRHMGFGQVQFPVRAFVQPDPAPHPLGAVIGARLLADPVPAPAAHRVTARPVDGQRRGRRRQVVVIGLSGARRGGQVELRHLPGRQVRGELRVRRCRHDLVRRLGHRPVVAVLARHVEEGRHQDIRFLRAHDLDEAGEGAGVAPLAQRLDPAFGKAEIGDRVVRGLRMPVHPHVEHVAGALHLAGAQSAEVGPRLGADVVLPAFAAGRAGVGQVDPVAKRQRRQQPRHLVVGMRARLHEPDHRGQRAQRPPQLHHPRAGTVKGDPGLVGCGHVYLRFARRSAG